MNRVLKCILPVLLIGIVLTPTMVKGSYSVSVGNTFVYNVRKAFVSIDNGEEYVEGNGYGIENTAFSNGTQVTVNVTGVIPETEVAWTLSNGSISESGTSSEDDYYNLGSIFLLFPLVLYEAYQSKTWNEAKLITQNGMGLYLTPFWDINYFGDFVFFAGPSYINPLKTNDPFSELTVLGKVTSSAGLVTFEWFLGGPSSAIGAASNSVDVQVNYQLKMVFDETTGVLQGVMMYGYVDGTYNDSPFTVELDYLVELVGFTMTDFTYTTIPFTAPGSGFEWFIAIGALTVSAIPVIIRIRKKQIK